MNWPALLAGFVAAFALGFLVYGPVLGLQKRWAEGSRLSGPPDGAPIPALVTQAAALFLLALVVAMTETTQSLDVAVAAILAFVIQTAAVGAWAQKSGFAIAVDTGYALGAGVLMVLAQALL